MTQSDAMKRAAAYALKGAPEDQRYVATRALVRRYAQLLDAADELADVDDDVVTALRTLVELATAVDPKAATLAGRRVERALRIANAADVTSDLGPKLLAALASMGMTVATTGAAGGGVTRGAAVATTFDEVRAARARRARKRGAASVDAASS